MEWNRILDGPSRADLDALDRLEARVSSRGDAYLVAGRPPDAGGERWITPADDALLFYLYARRPTLFLYFLDHTARYGAAGLETTCAALQAVRATRLREDGIACGGRWLRPRPTRRSRRSAGAGSAAGRCASGSRRCGRPAATAA